jgi:hypothetical protein
MFESLISEQQERKCKNYDEVKKEVENYFSCQDTIIWNLCMDA